MSFGQVYTINSFDRLRSVDFTGFSETESLARLLTVIV